MSSTGFLAIARQTFDIPFAAETATKALETLRSCFDGSVMGDAELATDTAAVAAKTAALSVSQPETTVVFQATFADSTLIREAARHLEGPLILWAVPEHRTGERLRLNSLCGVNLAAYVLARDGVDYRWVYRSPGDPEAAGELSSAISAAVTQSNHVVRRSASEASGHLPSLEGKVVGLVGERPEGFEPCDYDPEELRSRFGVSVDAITLEEWFKAAESAGEAKVEGLESSLADAMTGIESVDQDSLARSLQIAIGLSDLADDRGWSGVATRCWPECFTEFGGAACAGNSLMSSRGIPGSCEADVYGNVTALLLQELSDLPPFVADLVDIDRNSNTATFWHCGLGAHELAPEETRPVATIHSNRRKPLLNQFPLRPGRVTIARVSQSQNQIRMVVGGAEMLDAPLPFSGTSGVARMDNEVGQVLDSIMSHGLEHHYGIAYGDHRGTLRSYAESVGIDVVEL